jgi:hypothetical protein
VCVAAILRGRGLCLRLNILREGGQPTPQSHLHDKFIDKQHEHFQSGKHDSLPVPARSSVLPRDLDDNHHAPAGVLLSR